MFRFLLVFSLLISASYADTLSVLKKVPKKYDYCFKVDVAKLLKVEKLRGMMDKNDNFKKVEKTLEDKLGLSIEDVNSVYICGDTTQYYNLRDIRNIDIDSAFIIEFNKDIDLVKIEKEFPAIFKTKYEMHGVQCVQVASKEMKNAQAAFVSPRTVYVCPDYSLNEMLETKPTTSILANKVIVNLLKNNGFGGIFSIVHAGEILKVPAMTPWLKDYRGGTINVYYDTYGLKVEFSTNYASLESVKNASLMTSMGLNLLDMKPELKELKELVKFQVHDNNLYIDFEVSTAMLEKLQKMAEKQMNFRRGPKK